MEFKLTRIRFLFIVSHYASYVFGVLTLLEYFYGGYYYYFGIIATTSIISWLYSGFLFLDCCTNKFLGFVIWMLHLDYIFLTCLNVHPKTVKEEEIQLKQASLRRKIVTLPVQSGTSLLISVHYLFYTLDSGNYKFIANIILAIWLIAWSNVLLIKFNDNYMLPSFNSKLLALTFPDVFNLFLQSLTLMIVWGYISNIYRPLGAYIFVGGSWLVCSFLFLVFLCRNKHEIQGNKFVVAFFGGGLCSMLTDYSDVDAEYDPIKFARMLQYCSGFCLILLNFSWIQTNLFSLGLFWEYLLFVGAGCFVLWFFINGIKGFTEIKPLSEKEMFEYIEPSMYDSMTRHLLREDPVL